MVSCSIPPDQKETSANSKPAIILSGRVVDEADLLSDQAEAQLSKKLALLETTSGPQFVVVTTSSLDGREIEAYTLDLARSWAIGDKKRLDGVLLLVAPNERKVRIEVGYGLEGSLNDPFCAKVIREEIIPYFKQGKLEDGVMNGAEKLMDKMRQVPTLELNDNDQEMREAA